MAFCTPICKMFLKSSQGADKSRCPGKVTSEDEDTTRSECEPQPPSDTVTKQNMIPSKPNEDNRPRVLTKEEKLKQKRREEIERLREILRNRKHLLFGTVEVPVRRGTIEGYNITISRGKERNDGVKRRHTFDLENPNNRNNLQPTTRKSMEEFAKFIEAKIQQIEERKKINNRGDELRMKACAPDDPVQDALVDRLIELQPDKRKIARRKGSLAKEESKDGIPRKPRRMSDPSKTDDHPKRERPLDLTIKSPEKPVEERISKTRGSSLTENESKDDISNKSSRMHFSTGDDHPEREGSVDPVIDSPEKQTNHQDHTEKRGKPEKEKIANKKGSLTSNKSEGEISKNSRHMTDPSKIDGNPNRGGSMDRTSPSSEKQIIEPEEDENEEETPEGRKRSRRKRRK